MKSASEAPAMMRVDCWIGIHILRTIDNRATMIMLAPKYLTKPFFILVPTGISKI